MFSGFPDWGEGAELARLLLHRQLADKARIVPAVQEEALDHHYHQRRSMKNFSVIRKEAMVAAWHAVCALYACVAVARRLTYL